MEISFEKLKSADLIIETVYKGGQVSGKGSEVLSKLMPECSNSGGFRKRNKVRKAWVKPWERRS